MKPSRPTRAHPGCVCSPLLGCVHPCPKAQPTSSSFSSPLTALPTPTKEAHGTSAVGTAPDSWRCHACSRVQFVGWVARWCGRRAGVVLTKPELEVASKVIRAEIIHHPQVRRRTRAVVAPDCAAHALLWHSTAPHTRCCGTRRRRTCAVVALDGAAYALLWHSTAPHMRCCGTRRRRTCAVVALDGAAYAPSQLTSRCVPRPSARRTRRPTTAPICPPVGSAVAV